MVKHLRLRFIRALTVTKNLDADAVLVGVQRLFGHSLFVPDALGSDAERLGYPQFVRSSRVLEQVSAVGRPYLTLTVFVNVEASALPE
jgi:hypothetical protein